MAKLRMTNIGREAGVNVLVQNEVPLRDFCGSCFPGTTPSEAVIDLSGPTEDWTRKLESPCLNDTVCDDLFNTTFNVPPTAEDKCVFKKTFNLGGNNCDITWVVALVEVFSVVQMNVKLHFGDSDITDDYILWNTFDAFQGTRDCVLSDIKPAFQSVTGEVFCGQPGYDFDQLVVNVTLPF